MAKTPPSDQQPESSEPVINPVATPPTMIQLPLDQLQALMSNVMAEAVKMATSGQAAAAAEPNMAMQLALESLKASVAASTQLGEEIKRTVRRSNMTHSQQSEFNYDPRCELCREGKEHPLTGTLAHPKPPLIHETYFCYMKQKVDELTPVEVELFNSFTESTESRYGTWTATLERTSKKKTRLHVKVPCLTNDDLATAPVLEVILMELLYGDRSVNPVLAMERIKDLEAKMAALQAQLAARPSSGQ
jgi:hypothetical protein